MLSVERFPVSEDEWIFDDSFELIRIAFPGTGLSIFESKLLSELEFAVFGVFGGTSSSSFGHAEVVDPPETD